MKESEKKMAQEGIASTSGEVETSSGEIVTKKTVASSGEFVAEKAVASSEEIASASGVIITESEEIASASGVIITESEGLEIESEGFGTESEGLGIESEVAQDCGADREADADSCANAGGCTDDIAGNPNDAAAMPADTGTETGAVETSGVIAADVERLVKEAYLKGRNDAIAEKLELETGHLLGKDATAEDSGDVEGMGGYFKLRKRVW